MRLEMDGFFRLQLQWRKVVEQGSDPGRASPWKPNRSTASRAQAGTVVPLRASSSQFLPDLIQHMRTLIWLELVLPSPRLFTTS